MPVLRWTGLVALAAVLVSFCTSHLEAQSRTSSAIRGSIDDEAGRPLIGSEVTVRLVETGYSRATVTNADGAFVMLLLQPGGPYAVEVRTLGFSTYERSDLTLQVGETLVLNITLRSAAIDIEGLDVSVDRESVFDPTTMGPTTRLTARSVDAVPLLSRDISDLALLSPLVKRTDTGGLSVAGQNDRYNSILIDGVLAKDLFGVTSGGVPGAQAGARLVPLDAVAQYEVLVAPFDVRLSGFTGGVLNAVTRSGTNDWRIRGAAVHRSEALTGDLRLPTGTVEASGVERTLFAASAGGPVIPDRLHFYVAGEFEAREQAPVGYNLFRDDESLVRISRAQTEAIQNLADSRFGLATGSAGPYPLDHRLSNVFTRLDWGLSPTHRVLVRNVFASGRNDESPNRLAYDPYEFSSNAVFRESSSSSTSVQLFSDLGGLGANELEVSYARADDRSTPASEWPQVEVDVVSSIDGSAYQRSVRFGGDFFAQDNHVRQTSFRVTDALDLTRGDDIITVGVTSSYLSISQRYLPGAAGEFRYPSLAAFEADDPTLYQRGVLSEGAAPDVEFEVLEWGAFVQNVLTASPDLTFRFGVRLDVPTVLSRPDENVEVRDYYGYSTRRIPSGNTLVSPRWAVNWQGGSERRSQLRVGGGLFTGQIPYVWLADAFHNDGSRTATTVCSAASSPPLSLEGGSTEGCLSLRNAIVFDEGFTFPQDLKFSAGYDREVTEQLEVSLGALFSKSINQVALRNLDIQDGAPGLPTYSRLGDGRRFYGDRLSGRGVPSPFDNVLLVTNGGQDWSASFTAELRGRLSENIGIRAGYAFARSWDRTSLVFSDMLSNAGFTPIVDDVDKPPLEVSDFDRPHKFVLNLSGQPFRVLPDTELSLLYTAQSGRPFTYVYDFDVNGDGFPGLGGASDRYNDPVGVVEAGGELPGTIATQILTARALDTDDCLAANRGRVLNRNACRSPWEHRLDLRVAQTLDVGALRVRLEGDFINVLNLLNSDWGSVQEVRSHIPLYEDCGCAGPDGLPLLRWGGGVLPTRSADGAVSPTPPWAPRSPDSQWQIQVGARVTFASGGAGR